MLTTYTIQNWLTIWCFLVQILSCFWRWKWVASNTIALQAKVQHGANAASEVNHTNTDIQCNFSFLSGKHCQIAYILTIQMHIPKRKTKYNIFRTSFVPCMDTTLGLYIEQIYIYIFIKQRMLLFWKDIYSSWNHKVAFLTCTENDCGDSSCNGENVLWHMAEWLTAFTCGENCDWWKTTMTWGLQRSAVLHFICKR